MTQTNLFCRPSLNTTGFAQSLGMTVICLLAMFILGTKHSSAQTMQQLGELKSATVIKIVQGEMQSLELEMKNPGSGVVTDYNDVFIRYYSDVLETFRNGGSFKDALLLVLPPRPQENVFQPGNSQSQPTTYGSEDARSAIPAGADFDAFNLLVEDLNLADNDFSDLNAIFNFWRTFKNQQ